jgi:hypothetical protein
MKKSKPKIFKYTQPIYPMEDLIVIVTDDYSNLKDIDFRDDDNNPLEGMKPSWSAFTVVNGYYKKKPCLAVVLYTKAIKREQKNYSKYITYDVFAHESLHVAHSLLSEAGLQLSNETEECYAYVVGWVSRCLAESYNKK